MSGSCQKGVLQSLTFTEVPSTHSGTPTPPLALTLAPTSLCSAKARGITLGKVEWLKPGGGLRGLWLHCLGRNLLAPGVKDWCPGEGWGDTPRRHRSCAESCLGHRKLEGNCTDG